MPSKVVSLTSSLFLWFLLCIFLLWSSGCFLFFLGIFSAIAWLAGSILQTLADCLSDRGWKRSHLGSWNNLYSWCCFLHRCRCSRHHHRLLTETSGWTCGSRWAFLWACCLHHWHLHWNLYWYQLNLWYLCNLRLKRFHQGLW